VTTFSIAFVHLVALLAVLPYFFSWAGLVACLVLIWATASLGISLSYHRMLSHKSWRAKPWLRNFLTFLACLTLEMGPISWSATHRLHHRESDHEDDPHSPLVSFFWAHMGWLFVTHPIIDDEERKKALAPDLYRDATLRFFERNYVWLWVGVSLLLFAGGLAFGGLQLGLSLLIWGGFLRTVLVWHATWFVNSVTHLWGYRNYQTTDDSRNLWWVAVVTFGEGWHNNHHARAGTANFGHKWWEFDPTFWALALLNKLGWVEKLNLAEPLPADSPVKVLDGKIAAQSKALKSLLRSKRPTRARSQAG
jgi:stearoyl-CoA desaturase (delta-9 desaturase)